MEPIINTDINNIQQDNALNKLRSKTCIVKDDDAKLKEAAQGFEAIFVTKLLNQMHSSSMNEGGFIGRKLDFIAQEMNREANTILSKMNDISIVNTAIELKTDIEKVREQIQNIE